jgi:hypothetical protein
MTLKRDFNLSKFSHFNVLSPQKWNPKLNATHFQVYILWTCYETTQVGPPCNMLSPRTNFPSTHNPLQHIHELPHKFMKDSYNLCTILSTNSNQNCPSLTLSAMISTLYYSWHTLHQLSIHHWYFILSHHLGQTSLLEGFNLFNDHGWTWNSFSQLSSRILSIQTTQKHEMLWNWIRVGS